MAGNARQATLSSKAADGDPDAQFAYGLALLEGEGASIDGPRAIELVESSASRGHAGATAMCALFEAVGAGRPQSWTRALDRLRDAAEAGLEGAQGQLLTLCERGCTDPADAARGRDWGRMRAAISPDRLLQPAPREVLSDAPRIVAYPGFATKSECNWVIARSSDGLQRAKVFSASSGDQGYNDVRDNSAILYQLPQMDVVLEVLRARIAAATRLPVPIYEPVQVLHYSVGEQFRPHHDFLDPDTPGFAEQVRRFGQRIATMLIYLNDGYSGGHTAFPKIGLSYRGARGDALFFANVDRTGRGDPLTMHAGTPPAAGEKWVLSQWIRDRSPESPSDTGASAA